MDLVLNILVLIFEILYYSLFMKYARKESKFHKLILLFTMITIIGMIIGTNNLPSYLILILMMLFGMKHVARLKVSLYDMYGNFQEYSESSSQYSRGNYGAKEDTMKSLEYMMQSVVDFVEMLKEEAKSQEEMEIIKKYTRKISEM